MGESIAEVGYLAGTCQYTGAGWVKSNLLWGYNAILDINLGGIATGTIYTKSTSAIPSGEIWIVQGASLRNQTRSVTAGTIYAVRASAAGLVLADKRPLAQFDAAYFVGQIPLMTGDIITVAMADTVAGDIIWAAVGGYKMKLNM